MNLLRRRRAHERAATITTLLFAIPLCATLVADTAAHAATQVLVGVSSVRFNWTAASGSPTGYRVTLDRNGTVTTFGTVAQTSVDIPVSANDQVSITVAATGKNSAGATIVGPASAASDRIWVKAAAKFAAAGAWLMQCPTCPSIVRRSLADASMVLSQATGLFTPWRAVAIGTFQSGGQQIVWHNPSTGAFQLWDARLLVPIRNGTGSGSKFYRAVGAADLDRDGVDELIVQRTDTGVVTAWSMTSTGFVKRADVATSASTLAAARDFNGDGWVDLLWQDPISGTLDLWLLGKSPLLSLPLSSVISKTLRLATGMASDAAVVSTGDYDGDRSPDVLWRYGDGRLAVTYLLNGQAVRYAALAPAPGDLNRRVIDSSDVDGAPGDEIALQDNTTNQISVLLPLGGTGSSRIPVLNPGTGWNLLAIGP